METIPVHPAALSLKGKGSSAAHWRPGLVPARHSEIFASTREAGGAGMALALALDGLGAQGMGADDRRSLLWVQDNASLRLTGRVFRPGLPPEWRARVIHVAAQTAEDALFALEEGLRCRDLACVIGEIAGNPRALSLTASRRLSLAAEKHGVPLFLLRHDAKRDLSSARMRWDVRSAISPQPRWNPAAPGMPAWQADLFRARTHREGKWIVRNDGNELVAERAIVSAAQTASTHYGDLARAVGARSLAAKAIHR
jgi:protein ImuA